MTRTGLVQQQTDHLLGRILRTFDKAVLGNLSDEQLDHRIRDFS